MSPIQETAKTRATRLAVRASKLPRLVLRFADFSYDDQLAITKAMQVLLVALDRVK